MRAQSCSNLPDLSAHGALLPDVLLRLEPAHDALHVEGVATGAPQRRAVIAGVLDAWAARLERHAANAAHILVNLPLPHCHAVPAIHLDLHRPLPGPSKAQV